MRTHPPTLLTLVRRAILDEGLWEPRQLVLVAVSGGRDSMALLHALATLRRARGRLRVPPFELVAHGVDHGLRGEAPAELDRAAELALTLEVPFERSRVEVGPGGNLQARARGARYAALEAAARHVGAHALATAHHADDRAETLLMRLLRGSGPRGLAVLPPRASSASPPRVRPLIRARRADIDAHVGRHHLPFANDPSNQDPRFLRTRVRTELIPWLEGVSPPIVTHLCALADRLAESSPRAPLVVPADRSQVQVRALSPEGGRPKDFDGTR